MNCNINVSCLSLYLLLTRSLCSSFMNGQFIINRKTKEIYFYIFCADILNSCVPSCILYLMVVIVSQMNVCKYFSFFLWSDIQHKNIHKFPCDIFLSRQFYFEIKILNFFFLCHMTPIYNITLQVKTNKQARICYHIKIQ